MPKKSSKVGLSRAPRASRRGVGIGTKFAVPVSLVMAVVVGVFGWWTYARTADVLADSIDRSGIFAARTLAAPDWHNPDNVARLPGLVGGVVREVAIFERDEISGQPYLIATASGVDSMTLEAYEGSRFLEDVLVERGVMTLPGQEPFPYRSFTKTIEEPGGGTRAIASVRVFLSEERIEDELAGVLNLGIGFSVVGILVAVGTSFLVARVITRPIKVLVDDLRVVAQGDLKHRTRARSTDEIGTLAVAFDEMTRGLEEGLQARESLTSKEHQEQITQEIQEKLFPDVLPEVPGCAIDAACQPAGEISRDLFDVLDLGGGKVGLLLLHASGRGVPAAVVLAMARATFRAVATADLGPAATLKRINALFARDLRRGMYVTALYAVHDAGTGRTLVASAGHKLPALVHRAAAGELARVHPSGIAMGLDRGPVFDGSLQEAAIDLAVGDGLLVGTPGVLELRLDDGEILGESRFFKAVLGLMKTGEHEVARKLNERIEARLGQGPVEHDVTLVSLVRTVAAG